MKSASVCVDRMFELILRANPLWSSSPRTYGNHVECLRAGNRCCFAELRIEELSGLRSNELFF